LLLLLLLLLAQLLDLRCPVALVHCPGRDDGDGFLFFPQGLLR
jgi:hypothetical protein